MDNLNKYLRLKQIEREEVKKYSLLAPIEYYNDYYVNEESLERRNKKQETIKQLISQIDTANDMHK